MKSEPGAKYCPRLTRQRVSNEEDGLKARLELGICIIAVGLREDPHPAIRRAAESGLIGLNWRLLQFGSGHISMAKNAKAGDTAIEGRFATTQ
jgi:hypothetical protein